MTFNISQKALMVR